MHGVTFYCNVGALLCAINFHAAFAREVEVQSVILRLIDEAEIPAQQAGVLTAVHVREGQQVAKGALLAQVDDQVALTAERTAEIELEAARDKAANDVGLRYATKAHEVAKTELQRSKESNKRSPKSVSQSQIDVEQLTVEKTSLEREQAKLNTALEQFQVLLHEQQLEATRLQITQRQLRAPFAGSVVEVYIRAAEWVEPGEQVLRMMNVQRLKAEGFVPAEQVGTQLAGSPVRLTLYADNQFESSTPEDEIAGKVVFVSPEMDPITKQVRIWAEIDNTEQRLRPGQRVQMWVKTSTSRAP
jgi:RND family efflux transporter MFP subunit